jgi:hypothetical protein
MRSSGAGITCRRAVAAVAVVVVMLWVAACADGGRSPGGATGATSTSAVRTSAPVSLAPTSIAAPISDDQLKAWIATLPEGPIPDVPTLSGPPHRNLLVEHGLRVALPSDAFQLFGMRTPHGLVAWVLTGDQANGYTDDYFVSYLFLLDPTGRLLPIAHTLMGGAATDPSGRYVAWLQAGVRESDPHTVRVVDLTTRREVTHFAEPARATVNSWIDSGILIVKGGGYSVRTLDGRETAHTEPLVAAAADRVLVRDSGCLRVVDLGTGFRTPLFGCTVERSFTAGEGTGSENVEPFVALSRDGHWMIVDGLSVAVDTLIVRGRLMPAGIQRQHPAFFPLDATRVWGKIKNDFTQTYVALVCDLPAARCEKTPEPIVGGLW